MVAPLEQPDRLLAEQQREHNRHRLEFLALLIALGGSIAKLIEQERNTLLGQLTSLASTNSKLTSAQVGVVRAFIRSGMVRLARDIVHLTEAEAPAVARLAAELAGGEYDALLANEIRDVLNTGALGVPLADVFAQVFLQAMNNISGAVQRMILADAELSTITVEIEQAMDGLRKKVVGEVETQVNSGFNTVVQKVAIKLNADAMLYHLSPTIDHCGWCEGHAGKVYPVTDEVWSQLPRHRSCICWGEPVDRAEIEQPEKLAV